MNSSQGEIISLTVTYFLNMCLLEQAAKETKLQLLSSVITNISSRLKPLH